MLTLTEAEIEELEKLSNWLGCSKSKVVGQALHLLKNELSTAISDETALKIFTGATIFNENEIQKSSGGE